MPEAVLRSNGTTIDLTPESGITAGQVVQLKDGRAGFAPDDISSGVLGVIQVAGVARITKVAGISVLDGMDIYWDHSANNATFKPVNDRDFLVGVAVGDWDSASTLVEVALNVEGKYLIDVNRDGFRTAIVGTQALGGLALNPRGGCHNIILSATNEAQKVDILSVGGFALGANAIVEAIFAVPSDGAGTVVDVSIGVANATHATDADSITESVFFHLDANATAINAESDDGTTEVAATDTTKDYVEGSAVANLVHLWIDMRNPASVKMYVDGVAVLTGTTFNVNVAVGPLFLLLHIEKSASTDTYEFDLHRLRARIAEK